MVNPLDAVSDVELCQKLRHQQLIETIIPAGSWIAGVEPGVDISQVPFTLYRGWVRPPLASAKIPYPLLAIPGTAQTSNHPGAALETLTASRENRRTRPNMQKPHFRTTPLNGPPPRLPRTPGAFHLVFPTFHPEHGITLRY